jgi:hypothetical protein
MLDKNLDLGTEIFDQIIEVSKISKQQGKEIAENVDKHWNKHRNTGRSRREGAKLQEGNRSISKCFENIHRRVVSVV